jgi:tetratricopeptide (TPR) repeat protein
MRRWIVLAAFLLLVRPAWAARVLVLPIDQEAGPPGAEWIGTGLAFALDEAMARAGVSHVPLEHVQSLYEQEGLVASPRFSVPSRLALARQFGADILVTGSFHVEGEALSVRAEALEVRGDLRRLGRWEVVKPLHELLGLTETLGRDLFGALGREWPPLLNVGPQAFESYVRGRIADDPTLEEVYLRKAVELAPGYAEARCYLALVLRETGRVSEASEMLEQLSGTSFSRSYLALASLAEIRLDEGRLKEAWSLFMQSLKAGESPEAHLGLARLYLRQKKKPEALRELKVTESFGTHQEEVELLRNQAQAGAPDREAPPASP